MASAWICREWLDNSLRDTRGRPRRRREKIKSGMRGVKESDVWVVEWLEPDGSRKREKIAEVGRVGKRIADDRAAQINSQLTLGSYVAQSADSWATVKDRYIRGVLPTKRAKRTQEEIISALTRFKEIAKPKSMQGITTRTIDEFIAARLAQDSRKGGKVSASTVNKDLRSLRCFFRRAVKWKVMQEAPDISVLQETENDKPHYTAAQFSRMLEHCDAASMPAALSAGHRHLWWQSLLVLLWETGARIGETLSVTWDRIDIENRTMHVIGSHSKTRRPKLYFFDDTAASLLERLRNLAGGGVDVFVFEWPHSRSQLTKNLRKIQQAAGLDYANGDLKFHAIRRSVGNVIAELYGLDVAQQKLGHTSAAITRKHYAQAAMRSKTAAAKMPATQLLKVVG
jgi:integrase